MGASETERGTDESDEGGIMTREEITRMAREAGLSNDFGNLGYPYLPELERFADLIVAAERQRKAWDAKYWTAYEHDVAAAEREACALAAEAVVPRHTECGNKIAAAIRARGQG